MIEVQIRSELQHAWATAVETVDTFTGQAIKANSGDAAWSRFFALMGTAIARREQGPLVPGTPSSETDLLRELAVLARELNVVAKLQAWRAAIQLTEQNVVQGANLYLLVLDLERLHLTVRGFSRVEPAVAAYSAAEQEPNTNAVLVTVDTVAALPNAYPNYYLHTDLFLNALKYAMHAVGRMQHDGASHPPGARRHAACSAIAMANAPTTRVATAPTLPQREDVNRAGRILIDSTQSGTTAFEWAIDVINSWRVAERWQGHGAQPAEMVT